MPQGLPTSESGRFPAWIRGAGWALATLALWLARIEWPLPPSPGTDSSWQAALVLAHQGALQFGTDVQFTYGPWGYLGLNICTPEALDSKICWEILGGLAFSVTVVLVSAEMRGSRRWAFLAASVAAACFTEVTALVLMTLQGVVWLLPAEGRAWKRAAAIAWLSFLANQKFTFCMVAAAGVLVAAASRCLGGRWRAALALLVAYGAAYLAWWIGARQHLGNLLPYLRQSWQTGSGYSAAMFTDPPTGPLLAGLFLAALIMGALWSLCSRGGRAGEGAGAALILATGWFVAWKEAFTRADMHMVGFFAYSFLMALALHAVLPGSRARNALFLAIAVTSVAGLELIGTGMLAYGPGAAWQRLRDRPGEILETGRVRAVFMAQLDASRRSEDDPGLRSAVGRGTVDALTMDDSRILLNGLAFHPRPVIESYGAYTPSLAEADARFFASADAPQFVAVTMSTIDGHPAAMDDGPALAEIVRRYAVVRFTPNYTLARLRRPADGAAAAACPIVATASPGFGEEVAVPDGGGHPVWIEVEFHPTLLGRIRTLLYHAAELRMSVTTANGVNFSYRILPGMSRSGFFAQPWISNHGDFAALLNGAAIVSLRSVTFSCAGARGPLFWDPPRVRFRSLTDLPLGRPQ
jgi:hypothetical protein